VKGDAQINFSRRDPETEAERADRELREARKRITELEHRVTALQRVAKSAITLLAPYADSRGKPR
jgi:hypothetical protein